ncbi:MAG: flagellar export chaperone FlgN [Pirellulaceae bacterium]
MTENTQQPNRNDSIADQCIDHLAQEIDLLEQYFEVASAIYDQVGAEDPASTERQQMTEALSSRADQLSLARTKIKTQLAAYLGVPAQQATIRGLAEKLTGEQADTIRGQRARLLELETEIQKQNRTQSFLIRQSMDLYQRIAMELMDQKPGAPTYSSSGQLTANEAANILNTDC